MSRPTLYPALVALLLAASGASAQIDNPDRSTPTTLYFHVFDVFNNFVINTQPMDVDFFEVGGTNFPTLTGTAVNSAMAAEWDFNTIYGTSTAGPVEYDFIENGKPRFHFERGIAADVLIDENVQPVSYIYIDVRDVVGLHEASNVLPKLTVRVTMRTGDEPGTDAQYDQGELIMRGEQTATLCADGGTVAVPVEQACSAATSVLGTVLVPDAAGIVEFALPMQLHMDRISKNEAFNVRIDWWQEDPAGLVCAEDQCAEGYLRLAADQDHLPRLEMNILNPVYIDFIHPQVAAGTLLIHAGVNSPWGTYDVDAKDVRLTIEGKSTPKRVQQVIAQNQHVHGLHDQAAEVTYLWKFREEGAQSGEYTIRLEVDNMAKTATAAGKAGFKIEGTRAYGIDDTGQVVTATGDEDQRNKGSPAPLAIIPLVMALLRRRSA